VICLAGNVRIFESVYHNAFSIVLEYLFRGLATTKPVRYSQPITAVFCKSSS